MRTDWTNEEDEFLKQNFLKWYDAAIAEELGRTESSIRSRAARLGLSKKKGTFDDFTDDDIAFIKKHYQTMHTKIIAEHLGVSESKIRKYAISIGLKKSISIGWTQKEDDFIRRNLSLPIKVLAEHLGKSNKTVVKRIKVLGLEKLPRSEWAEIQIDYLKKNSDEFSIKELGKTLYKKEKDVLAKLTELNLSTTDWDDEKDLFLAMNLNLTYGELAKKFNVEPDNVSARVKHLKLKKIGNSKFSIHQEQLAEKNQHLSLHQLAELLNMHSSAVRKEMVARGFNYKRNGTRRTPEEWQKKILIEKNETETLAKLASQINESRQITSRWLIDLGLREQAIRFSEEEKMFIKENVNKMTLSQMEKAIKKPAQKIRLKIRENGWMQKSSEDVEQFSDYINGLNPKKTSIQDIAIEVNASINAVKQYMRVNGLDNKFPDRYSIKQTDDYTRFFGDKFNYRKKPETYGEWFLYWFKSYREKHITKVTADKYLVDYKSICDEGLGDEKLKNITRSRLQRYVNHYGESHSKKTVNDHLAKIRSSFRAALDDGLIKTNPAGNIQPAYKEQSLSQKELKAMRDTKKWLEIEEYQKLRYHLVFELGRTLLEDVDDERVISNRFRELAILIALKTGARFSEIIGLTRNDIDFKDHMINIDKTWNVRGVEDETFMKTKNVASVREIIVDAELMHIIQLYFNWQDRLGIETEYGTLFVRKNKRVFNADYNSYLGSMLEKLGIERITMHKLRHTQASYLLAQKVSIEVVAKRLGHTDSTMVREVYGHLLKTTEDEGNRLIKNLI